jgi:hypothetical protein
VVPLLLRRQLQPGGSLAGGGGAVRIHGSAAVRPQRGHLGETGPLSQGVQARRKALRMRHINGMEVRKKI